MHTQSLIPVPRPKITVIGLKARLAKSDAMLLDHISLVPEPACGKEKWPGDEAKTIPCTFTLISLQSTPTHCC